MHAGKALVHINIFKCIHWCCSVTCRSKRCVKRLVSVSDSAEARRQKTEAPVRWHEKDPSRKMLRGLRKWLGEEVLAMQAWEHDFRAPEPMENLGTMAHALTPALKCIETDGFLKFTGYPPNPIRWALGLMRDLSQKYRWEQWRKDTQYLPLASEDVGTHAHSFISKYIHHTHTTPYHTSMHTWKREERDNTRKEGRKSKGRKKGRDTWGDGSSEWNYCLVSMKSWVHSYLQV